MSMYDGWLTNDQDIAAMVVVAAPTSDGGV